MRPSTGRAGLTHPRLEHTVFERHGAVGVDLERLKLRARRAGRRIGGRGYQ